MLIIKFTNLMQLDGFNYNQLNVLTCADDILDFLMNNEKVCCRASIANLHSQDQTQIVVGGAHHPTHRSICCTPMFFIKRGVF